MREFRWLLLTMLLFFCLGLSAEVVSETAAAVKFRQPNGTVVTLHKYPKRVVICHGSLVQVWYAAGGTAVGIPHIISKKTLPEAARHLPTVGIMPAPNPEKILVLKPDLVLLMNRLERHHAVANVLNRAGVETVLIDYANYPDFASLLNFFGHLNGDSAAARAEAKRVADEVDAICRKSQAMSKPSVAIVFAAGIGFRLESEHSNTGTMVKMLGGKNIVSGVEPPRVSFSYEQFFLDDPEVIFVITMGRAAALKEKFKREIMSQAAWKKLRAAKDGRVYFLPADLFLYEAGMRYPEAFRYLAERLHPDWKKGADK